MTYYVGQEVMAATDTIRYKKDDKIIIADIQRFYLFDMHHKNIHINNVKPSFVVGDSVWDDSWDEPFVVHHIVDDMVYSSIPDADGLMFRGRHISHVRRDVPLPSTATMQNDTERLDWLLNNLDAFTKYVKECPAPMRPNHRTTLDLLRSRSDDGWTIWHGGKQPVRDKATIEYKLRVGIINKTSDPSRLYWEHYNMPGDIVAYRIIK